ncbi:metal ABC transporter permease [Brockia lithotrophica]|uniref:Manganese/zinc/iron transport system permease protein n=1 Tax=Brockia lithotrophica TaxID=933949 RepID=A0A660L7L7_9BACL|nr:metal ABC transporter permease [Brockia lithotrophica]RKQ88849.1 manganese/zinc/iron transport system permease protein [Brockia lithotrophica]
MADALWVTLAAVLVAAASGLMGTFLVLRRLSMVGDAISHTVLLGVIAAFLLTKSMGNVEMLLGAALAGILTVLLIRLLESGGVAGDAAIGVTFTTLFALGVVLVSHFAKSVHIDLQHVLFGEIAYVPWDRLFWRDVDLGPKAVWTMGGVFLADLLFVLAFFKELRVLSFDPTFARLSGIPVSALHYAYMLLLSLTIVVAFDAVGAILTVAMLVVPPATAHLLFDRLEGVLVGSVVLGAVGGILGYLLASLWDVSLSGMMSVVEGACFAAAVLFAPRHGVLARRRFRRASSGQDVHTGRGRDTTYAA